MNDKLDECEHVVVGLTRLGNQLKAYLNPEFDHFFTDCFQMAAKLKRLKELAALVEEFRKTANKLASYIENNKLLKAMEDAEMQSVFYEGVGNLKIMDRFKCKINPSKYDEALQFLEDVDPSTVKKTIHAMTLNARAAEALREGDPFPPDLFVSEAVPYVKLTKTKEV